jgi:hypothetical protein
MNAIAIMSKRVLVYPNMTFGQELVVLHTKPSMLGGRVEV